MKKIIFILLLIISMFLIMNCSSLVYDSETEQETNELENVETLNVDFIEIVLTSEDDSLNSIKESVTDYILQKLSLIDKMKLDNNLILYKKDVSSIIYNLDSADRESSDLLKNEFEEEESDKDEDDGKNGKEGEDGKSNNGENDGKDGDEGDSEDGGSDENDSGEDKEEKVIENIVSDIPEYVLIPLEDSKQESIINEVLGKDPATIENEKSSTYTLNMPDNVSNSAELLPEDFDNDAKLIAKLLKSEKHIVICSLIEIKSDIISLKIKIINNILHQLLGEIELTFDKMDYQRGDVFIEPSVWNKIKPIFLGDDIASLKVTTNIDNVLVYIDDKYVGRTRKESKDIFSLSLDAIESGSHKIKLIKNNYKKIEGYIHLGKGQNSLIKVEMELLKSQSAILLYISESDADVWLDMSYVGTTSKDNILDDKSSSTKEHPYLFIIDDVYEGVHKIRVEKDGFNPFVKKVTIDGISDKLVKVTLEDYNEKLFDPDYRSAPFKVTFEILLYSSLLSLSGAIVSFFEFNTFEDELYSIGGLYGGIDNLRYEDIKNNYRSTETWKNIFSATTILFILGSITFKWIELDRRNIQIGLYNNTNILFEPIISFDNNKEENLKLGFSLGYNF